MMFDLVIEINPKITDAYLFKGINIYSFKGNALDKLERYNEAIIMYERALERFPNYEKAYSNIGILG